MLVPIRWLRTYVETDLNNDEIAATLTSIGLEVEEIANIDLGFTGVVTARVESAQPHPNADKLRVCKVTDGNETYDVVCGAPNVREGLTVAFAKIGARIDDFTIKKSKIRGEPSFGMICSAKELGISEESEGIMELDSGFQLNVPLGQALGLEETVLEVSVTPNRPDCLSMIGIARELAAAIGTSIKLPPVEIQSEHGDVNEEIAVRVEASAGCPRYSARVVKDVTVGPSPEWMQKYLQAAGVRPINNIVDITNFVMMETGHPMHAFDRRQITGNTIVVRWANDGETLLTLDEIERKLEETDVIIANSTHPVALGGIMGGEKSGIQSDTKNVVLEAAFFDPGTIRRTSKRLKIHSESSHRFERGCDPNGTLRVLDRAAHLLDAHAGGTVVAGHVDNYPRPIKPATITLRITRLQAVLGLDVPRHEVERALKRLGLSTGEQMEGNLIYDPDSIRVQAPTYRPDLREEIDLIEEVARLIGYDKIPETPPSGDLEPVQTGTAVALSWQCRRTLAGMGLDETISFIFTGRGNERSAVLLNPLNEEQNRLRTSLCDSLLQNLYYNLSHQNSRVEIFEVGRVFSRAGNDFEQELRCGILLAGETEKHWRSNKKVLDFYTIKGVVTTLLTRLGFVFELVRDGETSQETDWFHPGRMAKIKVGNDVIGVLGEIHPEKIANQKTKIPVVLAELRLEAMSLLSTTKQQYRGISTYPRVDRDLALLVPETATYAEIRGVIERANAKHLHTYSRGLMGELCDGPCVEWGLTCPGCRFLFDFSTPGWLC